MKKFIFILLAMFALSSITSSAQEVKREGNTFTQTSKSQGEEKKTDYVYIDSKGVTYPIWLSKNGKAFIWVTPKKGGSPYKRYIPEVGKQINPKAYDKPDKPDKAKKN